MCAPVCSAQQLPTPERVLGRRGHRPRLVHHSVILEFDVPSFRAEDARSRTPNHDKKETDKKKKEEETTKRRGRTEATV